MKLLLCMLLVASPTSVELLDETSTIAAGKWNFYPSMRLRQLPVKVAANFEVVSGGEARLAMLLHEDTERLFKDAPHGVLAATTRGGAGGFVFRVQHPDDYDIVVDNRDGKRDVTVRVRVSLDFGASGPDAVTVSRTRQLTVVALSFMFFFAVVTYSARRILRAIGR